MTKFTKQVLIFFSPIIICACTLNYYYYNIFLKNQCGDLEALGGFSIPNSTNYYNDLFASDLKKELIEFNPAESYENISCCNFGDSFSGYAQKEESYVNHMAIALGKENRVLNSAHTQIDGFVRAVNLLNNGDLKRMGCKVVIIQSIERYIVYRINHVDINESLSAQAMFEKYIPNQEANSANNANNESVSRRTILSYMRESFNWLLLQPVDLRKGSARKAQLSEPHFSIGENNLYFLHEDLWQLAISESDLSGVKDKINALRDRFKAQGITLIILGISDKYAQYQDYIIDNPYTQERKILLEQIDAVVEQDLFVNTRTILHPYMVRGVKDLYLANDCHWTKNAAKPVGEAVAAIVTKNL